MSDKYIIKNCECKVKGKTHYLGSYKTIEEAKQKYDEWVLQEDNQ